MLHHPGARTRVFVAVTHGGSGGTSCVQILAYCTNLLGDYKCTCFTGYQGDGTGPDGCMDADECTDGSHTCNVRPQLRLHLSGHQLLDLMNAASISSMVVEWFCRLWFHP
jgi:hypothetical protein